VNTMPRHSFSRATCFLCALGILTIIFFLSNTTPSSIPELPPVIQEQSRWYDPLNVSPRFRVGLIYAQDGFVKGWDSLHDMVERDLPLRQRTEIRRLRESHPILELVERGRRRWEGLLARFVELI